MTLSLSAPVIDRPARVAAVQQLCVLAAMIGELIEAQRLCWSPAGLWSPVAALADAVAAGEERGVPPVMHLAAFLPAGEGEGITRGLAFFAGSELLLAGAGRMACADQPR